METNFLNPRLLAICNRKFFTNQSRVIVLFIDNEIAANLTMCLVEFFSCYANSVKIWDRLDSSSIVFLVLHNIMFQDNLMLQRACFIAATLIYNFVLIGLMLFKCTGWVRLIRTWLIRSYHLIRS